MRRVKMTLVKIVDYDSDSSITCPMQNRYNCSVDCAWFKVVDIKDGFDGKVVASDCYCGDKLIGRLK